MKRPRIPMLRSAIEFLRANGAQDIEPFHGGKHPKIRFQFQGVNLTTVTSISPSDRQAAVKQRAQLKRLLRRATAKSISNEQKSTGAKP